MKEELERIRPSLSQWAAEMETMKLPEWEMLPDLELYMDQVVLLLSQYLAPLNRGQEDKFITASIVNNYVRLKVIPPPVKKRYTRVHLASLIMICILKQSLSIACIQQLLPLDQSEEEVRMTYEDFICRMRTVSAKFVAQMAEDSVASAAILATLSKSLTEYISMPTTGKRGKE